MSGQAQRNRFKSAGGSTYQWLINHTEEEEFGRRRNIDHSAPTSGIGHIRQQGDDEAMVLSLTGHILHRSQYVEMFKWFDRSRKETIQFRDFDMQEFEVIITSFRPVRKRTLRNPRDTSIPHHYWDYSMEMEVITFLDGDLEDMKP
jgi:hypothetical protein